MTENAPREMEKRMTFEKNMEGLARKRRLKDGAFKERKGREEGRKEGGQRGKREQRVKGTKGSIFSFIYVYCFLIGTFPPYINSSTPFTTVMYLNPQCPRFEFHYNFRRA